VGGGVRRLTISGADAGTVTILATGASLISFFGANYSSVGLFLDDKDNVFLNQGLGIYNVTNGTPTLVRTLTNIFQTWITVDKVGKKYYSVGSSGNTVRYGSLSEGAASDISFTSYTISTNPHALVVDPTGKYFITYTDANTVASINIATGTMVNIAGTPSTTGNTDGPAGSATFGMPNTLNTWAQFGPDGTLYLADLTNGSIRTIKGPATVATPPITTYYPKAGALI
jgi:hypothetical protein